MKREGELRGEVFAEKIVTKIWREEPSEKNPYLAENCFCHGYDLLELSQGLSFTEMIFLLLGGEIPTKEQAQLLNILMVGLSNPGPRHPATWAAMNAVVGKTKRVHILPIGLGVLGGEFLGGEEVEQAMIFLKSNKKNDPIELASNLLENSIRPEEGDWHIIPGFGSQYGGINPVMQKLADLLLQQASSGEYLKWCQKFVEAIKLQNLGWLATGLAGAVFCDLGFHYRTGGGLFQLMCAPGILAHGIEMCTKPRTAMPFLDEEHYVISKNNKSRRCGDEEG